MVALFRCLTALNVLSTLALVLSVIAGVGVFADLRLPTASVEIQLIPLEPVRPAPAPAVASTRLEIPVEFQPPDFAIRPWLVLPDGSVRMRD